MNSEQIEHKDWDVSGWHYLYGKPSASAVFKKIPEDFIVTESLSFEPLGEGEHLFLLIEKRQLNTQQVCEYLAKHFSKRLRDVGYAGLKDKQSVSQQWFSIQLNVTSTIDLKDFGSEDIKLVKAIRHNKKLRIGALKANHFSIRLRDISDWSEVDKRLHVIKEHGVPNYFGPQRFGIKGNNLNWFERLVQGEQIRNKKLKGFALSAGRSFLFNNVVSKRVELGGVDKFLEGDVFILDGSHSYFTFEQQNEGYQKRLDEFDIHISAPLFGEGESPATSKCLELEDEVEKSFSNWHKALCDQGLEHERRSIRLKPSILEWQKDDHDLLIKLEIPTGCFATSVLRELVELTEQESI